MASIAISYRRKDTQAEAGRIFDRLALHFGKPNVFMDIDNIPLGVDFRTHLGAIIGKCEVLVAVIGPNWAGAESGRDRIADETDWVRVEIETALERNIPIVPILIDDAEMPQKPNLPTSLQELVYRQALRVDSGQDFGVHIERLIRSLDQIVGKPTAGDAGGDLEGEALLQRPAVAPDRARNRRAVPVGAWAGLFGLAYFLPLVLCLTGDQPLDGASLKVAILGAAVLIAAGLPMIAPLPPSARQLAAAVILLGGVLVFGFIAFEVISVGFDLALFPAPWLLLTVAAASLGIVAIGGYLLAVGAFHDDRRAPPRSPEGAL